MSSRSLGLGSKFAAAHALLAGVLLLTVPARAETTLADEAVVAKVGGAPVTAGEVRDVLRGGGGADPAAALDRIVESRLLYAEGVRRGVDRDPAIAARMRTGEEQVLIEQYVLWKYGAELRTAKPLAEIAGHSDQSAAASGGHGSIMATAKRLQTKIERLRAEAGKTEKIVFLADVYQKRNETGKPRGELVVARSGDQPILWAQVEEVTPSVKGLEPPLLGMDAWRFAGGIKTVAGTVALRAEAEKALPSFKAVCDRARDRTARSIVVRRLLELEGARTLGEEQLKSFYTAHPELYPGPAGPQPFAQVREKVAKDAANERQAALRSDLVKRLRGEIRVETEPTALENLGK